MNIKAIAIAKSSRGLLQLRKYSPEILTGLGIVSGVASTVLTVKATLEVEPILEEHQQRVAHAKVSAPGGMDNVEVKRNVAKVYARTGLVLTKHYGPAASLGLTSITCVLAAHGVMRQRNAALLATTKAVESAFSAYRDRVKEELGEEKERDIYYNLHEEEIETADGKQKVKVAKPDSTLNPYAACFDELNPNWQGRGEYNLYFLKAQQNYWNDMLKVRGHVFLNEVRQSLGFDHTKAGALTGWVAKNGDDFIDFGIYDVNTPMALEFVNGNEKSVWLDFNVDGVIVDLI